MRNEQGESLGKIDEVLTGSTGRTEILVKVNNRRIAVGWSRLVFDTGSSRNGTVVIPGETRDALERQPPFKEAGNG